MVFSKFTLTDLWYNFGENEIPRTLTQELGECSEIWIFHDIITPSFVFTPLTITLTLWKLAAFDDWPNMSLIGWDVGMDFHFIVCWYSDLKMTSGKSRFIAWMFVYRAVAWGKWWYVIQSIFWQRSKKYELLLLDIAFKRLVLFVRLHRKGCRGNGIVASWSTETRAASGFDALQLQRRLENSSQSQHMRVKPSQTDCNSIVFLNSSD